MYPRRQTPHKRGEDINKKKEKKRVKFESQIIDSVNNYELGKSMAESAINTEIVKNETLESEIVNNMQKDYQEPSEIMVKHFQEINNNINQEISKESKKFVGKMDIIKEIEDRENTEIDAGKNKDNLDLSDIFKNMKLKTKDSDIIAVSGSNNNMTERMDKLEQYLIDIIRNQQLMLQKINIE